MEVRSFCECFFYFMFIYICVVFFFPFVIGILSWSECFAFFVLPLFLFLLLRLHRSGTRCGDGFPVITRIMQVAISDMLRPARGRVRGERWTNKHK